MRAVIIGAVESTRVAIRVVGRTPGWDLAALVTLPPERAGRHSDFVDLAPDARAAGAPLIAAADGNADDVVAEIAGLGADVGLVIGWSQICRPPLIAAVGGTMIGYHPAPLPRLRGRAAIPWTILLAEPITAGTLFRVDEGVDSGPILAQRFFHVAPDETARGLYDRHMQLLDGLMEEALAAVSAGAPGIPQDPRHATWAARRGPSDGAIDWCRSAAEVDRLIRAVTRPYPGAFTAASTGQIVCWTASAFPDAKRHAAAPGQVIARTDQGFAVMCGDGAGLWIGDHAGVAPRLHEKLRAA